MYKEFCEVPGVAGREMPIARRMEKELSGHFPQCGVDDFGNLVAVKPGRPAHSARRTAAAGRTSARKIMLAAHMDEVGMLVKSLREDGFIRVAPSGNLLMRYWIGREVQVNADAGPVVGILEGEEQAVHGVSDAPEASLGARPAVKAEDLFLDVGAGSKAEVEAMGIRIGDSVSWRMQAQVLEERGVVIGRAADDRAGCAIIVEAGRRLAQELKACSICVVGTVQEESLSVSTAFAGATVAGQALEPDVGFVTDIFLTADMPGQQTDKAASILPIQFRGGLGILRGAESHEGMTRLLVETCEERAIPFQLVGLSIYGTDALALRATGKGVMTGVFGPTARYHHSPCQMTCMKEMLDCVELIVHAAKKIEAGYDLSLR
jgi:endoglucanase